MLLATDWVWQDGADARLRAADVLPPGPAAPVPDWLADVAEVEKKELQSGPAAPSEGPEWLEDLRLWIALEQYQPGWEAFNKTADSTVSTQAGNIPEWLASWSVPAAPKESRPAQLPVVPALASPIAKAPIPVPALPKAPLPAAAPPLPPRRRFLFRPQ